MQVILAKNGRQELWILTSSFQKFMTATMNSNETNFRIQAGYVDELIRGTKCNSASLRLDHTRGYETSAPASLFAKWRSWHHEKFDDSHFQEMTSVWWHKYPEFFPEYHHSPFLSPSSYSFPRIFIRPSFFPWVVKSIYSHRPVVDYTIFIDHSWKTRDTICTLILIPDAKNKRLFFIILKIL